MRKEIMFSIPPQYYSKFTIVKMIYLKTTITYSYCWFKAVALEMENMAYSLRPVEVYFYSI